VQDNYTMVPAGTTEFVLLVVVNGDDIAEAAEKLYFDIYDSTNASILDGHAIGTITNDD
jgi:hypothetical protein